MFSTHNLPAFLIGGVATGGAALLDDEVRGFFSSERRGEAIGEIGGVAGSSGVLGGLSGAFFVLSYQTTNHRFRSMSFDLAQGMILSSGFYWGLKGATHRMRPSGDDHLAFPSGHASDSTMFATVVSHYYPKLSIPMYLFAGFVSVSRLEKDRHWLSDVVGGATLGYIIGRTVVRGSNPLRVGRVQFMPSVPPGGGLAVSATIH